MNTNFITVAINCTIRRDKIDAARQELEEVIKIVMREEPACHGIWVHVDPLDLQRMLIIEHWDNEDIFKGPHMQTPHMQAFLAKAGDFLDGEAEFTFWKPIFIASPAT